MLDLRKQIRKWCIEYKIDCDDIIPIYQWIDEHTLGITYFKRDIVGCRICDIKITDVFMDYEIASKAVLWHEFCHAEKWLKDGKTDGHVMRGMVDCVESLFFSYWIISIHRYYLQ